MRLPVLRKSCNRVLLEDVPYIGWTGSAKTGLTPAQDSSRVSGGMEGLFVWVL